MNKMFFLVDHKIKLGVQLSHLADQCDNVVPVDQLNKTKQN